MLAAFEVRNLRKHQIINYIYTVAVMCRRAGLLSFSLTGYCTDPTAFVAINQDFVLVDHDVSSTSNLLTFANACSSVCC